MLIAIGSARARPGRREDLASAARAMVRATRDDDGCQAYGFFADLTDADTIVSLEVWRDQDALDAHMAHPHTQDFIAVSAELIDGSPSLTVHLTSGSD